MTADLGRAAMTHRLDQDAETVRVMRELHGGQLTDHQIAAMAVMRANASCATTLYRAADQSMTPEQMRRWADEIQAYADAAQILGFEVPDVP